MATRIDPRVERSRAAILAGGQAVLEEEGWDAVTQERVAARAGVGRATVYRHWPTKAGLLVDVIESLASAMHGETTEDLRNDLVAELDRFQTAMADRSNSRLLAALAHFANTDPDIEHARNRMVSIHSSFIRQTVERGIRDGALDPDTSAEQAVAELMGPACYRVLLSGEATPRSFAETVVDRFLLSSASPLPAAGPPAAGPPVSGT